MANKKQSVLKLAREKKKASARARRDEIQKAEEPQLSPRGILRNILKKVGHGGKQIETIISSMDNVQVNDAIENWKLKNDLEDL
ncbi:MAG: hypothetical protein HQL32_02135 [Planctomycetes bacterium]|nr:hypothetical protein [Planctomycetota bacterium]